MKECNQTRQLAEKDALRAEIVRLQGIIEGMAERIARQSDQLSRRAVRGACGPDDEVMPGILPQWRLDMLRKESEKRQKDSNGEKP